jgi:XRE family transcriptional regulator, regulator of sulfur utilization
MVEHNLGVAIRELRRRRKLGLRVVAKQTGFSPAFLSQVENGQASPSLASMERIAQALGVTLGEFFNGTQERRPIIVRAQDRPGLNSEWSRARIEAIGHSGPEHRMHAILVTLECGGASGKKPHVHSQEQLAFVLSGRIQLTLGSDESILRRGDAVMLLPEVPRLWRNVSTRAAQVLIVSAG